MVTSETAQSPCADPNFGHLLADLRRRKGMTQEDLAEKTGYSVSQIRKVENGTRRPSPNLLRSIDEHLALIPDERRDLENAVKGRVPNENAQQRGQAQSLRRITDVLGQVVQMIGDALPIAKPWIYALVTLLSLLLIGLISLVGAVTFQTIRTMITPSSTTTVLARQDKPGGVWVSPKNGQHFRTTLRFAARAYPATMGVAKIKFVNFTVSWDGRPGPWIIVCQPHHAQSLQSFSDVYTCQWNPKKRHQHIPAGKLNVSFDVYDEAGNANFSPEGTRVIDYVGHH